MTFLCPGACRVASVSRFGKESKVIFIAEDEDVLAHMKKRWPTQTLSLEDLHLKQEASDSSRLTQAYASRHVRMRLTLT